MGSHRTLSRDGWPDIVFVFHDQKKIGSRMLGNTGLQPEDL
ncbi:MAG: type II toxin-antitoxin system HicA family toxin [Methylococcales bacterium]